MRDLIDLFLAFSKIGALTFGGGYSMIPLITRDIAQRREWLTQEELADRVALSQCLPGIIAVNLAAFIGYRRRGVLGGVIASLGVVFPSIVVILIISAFLTRFYEHPAVQSAFAGIRVCVCVLILNAVIDLWKSAVSGIFGILIFAAVFLLSVFFNISAVILVAAAGVIGIAVGFAKGGTV